MNKVLVICGPTATGKTGLSLFLAEKYNGEIINGDSMQVYKEMQIGTAKIKEDEMRNIPHHLLNIKTIKESFSVAEFQTLVRNKIQEISNKGKLPIIVGGTGLYLKAALYDYEFKEAEKKDYGLENKDLKDLQELLKSLDPVTYNKVDLNNKKRVIRAIEIFYETGIGKENINQMQEHKPLYDVLYLGLTRDRKELYKLIDQRVDEMVKDGLIEEVKYVYEHASKDSTCRQAIGYKELFDYFEGNKTLEECIQRIKFNTHQYAKRQYTWFNHQMNVKWVDVSETEYKQTASNIVEEFING